MTFGITNAGNGAEELFMAITGATKCVCKKDGDVVFEGYPIEIKKTSSKTINQVRAVKYIPVVVYHEPKNVWYVLPPHVVVKLVSRKTRGQHTECAFESANLSIDQFESYICSSDELKDKIIDAVLQGDEYLDLKKEMAKILYALKILAIDSVENVRAALSRCELV